MMRRFIPVLFAGLVGACTTSSFSGDPLEPVDDPSVVGASSLPIQSSIFGFTTATGLGSVTVVAPGIAVTSARNANLVAQGDVIGVSRDYGLVFFRTRAGNNLPRGTAFVGQSVVAYGYVGEDGMHDPKLHLAQGKVSALVGPVQPNCPNCPQAGFAFQASAGPGFSGGAVRDSISGALIGVVFAGEGADPRNQTIYAYHIRIVDAELARLGGVN